MILQRREFLKMLGLGAGSAVCGGCCGFGYCIGDPTSSEGATATVAAAGLGYVPQILIQAAKRDTRGTGDACADGH